jgi:hypothetical protein
MSSRHPAPDGRRPVFPPIRGLVHRMPGAWAHVRLIVATVALMVVVLVAVGVGRARRVAEFAPVSVVDSREPLQELPVRVASGGEAVEPAHTYDAMLDASRVGAIVVGVDLDYVMKGLPRYDVVLRGTDGSERFRGRIKEGYFREGRFMLRLFARKLPPGDYTLDVEGFDDAAAEGRIIASSWFQILH